MTDGYTEKNSDTQKMISSNKLFSFVYIFHRMY